MKTTITNPTSIFINGQLTGSEVIHQVKSLIELNGIFEDQIALKNMDGSQPAYEVDAWLPVQTGTEEACFSDLLFCK